MASIRACVTARLPTAKAPAEAEGEVARALYRRGRRLAHLSTTRRAFSSSGDRANFAGPLQDCRAARSARCAKEACDRRLYCFSCRSSRPQKPPSASQRPLLGRATHLQQPECQNRPLEVLRFMINQEHCGKAGIDAVTAMCLVNHESQYFSLSIFPNMTGSLWVGGARNCSLRLRW